MSLKVIPLSTDTQAYVPAVQRAYQELVTRISKDFPTVFDQPVEITIGVASERDVRLSAELKTTFWSRLGLAPPIVVLNLHVLTQAPRMTDIMTEARLLYLFCYHVVPYAAFKDFNNSLAQGWTQYANMLLAEFQELKAMEEAYHNAGN